MDEKWSFVGKKQANCDPDDPADEEAGDHWDHVAIDAESRLVLAVVPGKKTAENCLELVQQVHDRMNGVVPALITTDEYHCYPVAIAKVYCLRTIPLVVLPRNRGRQRVPRSVVSPAVNHAVVHKHRENGVVTKVEAEVVYGSIESVAAALENSTASTAVNTAFVERQNGTDRHRNARKGRKTYRFSKDPVMHAALTFFTMYVYNFCWPVRTLTIKDERGIRQKRTPAMAAGLTDRVWTLAEWLTYPATQ